MLYKYGKIKREGAGLSFFYYGPTSTIVAVPIASIDMPFVFQEATADFQTVSYPGTVHVSGSQSEAVGFSA
ncbi:MAG TPA: hypothetical protein VKB47_12720 [Terracidiphilus sp.]|nr:hypothetical protein [Terracidiphilus sp.]